MQSQCTTAAAKRASAKACGSQARCTNKRGNQLSFSGHELSTLGLWAMNVKDETLGNELSTSGHELKTLDHELGNTRSI